MRIFKNHICILAMSALAVIALDRCSKEVSVSSVRLSQASVTLRIGETTTLAAIVEPSDADYDQIEWSSTSPSVVSIINGMVTAKQVGVANITASTGGKTSAPCIVTVEPLRVTGVTISRPSLVMNPGETYILSATVTPPDATIKDLSWSSDDQSVVTVNGNGMVTALSPGIANVIVQTATAGVSAVCQVQVNPIPVESVSVTETSVSLRKGETYVITATINPSDASCRDVVWSSDNPNVAIISDDGTITAIGVGVANISVTTIDQSKSAECQVTVEPILVENVTLSETSVTLSAGSTYELKATISPVDATCQELAWSSDNTDIAIISDDGTITAIGIGVANISVVTIDQSKSAECQVTVEPIPVEDVTMSETSIVLRAGGTRELKAAISPADATYKDIVWESDNADVAVVDESGVVTAVSVGRAVVTVRTVDRDKSSECLIIVEPTPVQSVVIHSVTTSLKAGETTMLKVEINPSDATNQNIVWTSDNPGVASVDQTGTVTALSVGEARITATVDGVKSDPYPIKVEITQVEKIDLVESSLELFFGDKHKLETIITPPTATDQKLTWQSDNLDVATVDQSGVVTATGVGTATIACFSSDGMKKDECLVTVKMIFIESVKLDKKTLDLEPGQEAVLTAEITPSNATEKKLYWSSSNPEVATVDDNGVVKALSNGATTITVLTSYGGLTTSCQVTVTSFVPVSFVQISTISWDMAVGETYTLTVRVYPDDATDKSVRWVSNNEDVAIVSQTGKVVALREGTATITVTSNDGGYSKRCKVIVHKAAVPVAGVTLSSSSLNLKINDTHRLTATITPSNATNKEVAWSSSNSNVASVSSDGTVTAKATGSATITCTTSDGAKKATCSVSVTSSAVPITGLSLNRSYLSMIVGQFADLTIAVSPANAQGSLRIFSSNNNVADVSVDGSLTFTVKAVSRGTAIITVQTEDGKVKATCQVEVTNATVAVSGVSISPTSLSLTPGQTSKLTATISPSNATNTAVSWTSSNTSVATVASDGTVTAKTAGSATITCTTQDGNITAKSTVTVTAPSLVSLIPRREGKDGGENIFRYSPDSDNLFTTVKDMASLYSGVGMDQNSFHVFYDEISILSGSVGEVSDNVNNSGYHQLRWTLSEDELWQYSGREISATVRYYNSNFPSNYYYIDVRLTASVEVIIKRVDLRSSNGDYKIRNWINPSSVGERGLATKYTATIPSSSSSNPNSCQIVADINASFVTTSNGKLNVDGIDGVDYYFCKRDMEAVTKIGDLWVEFRVEDDYDYNASYLYARINNGDEEQVASIINNSSRKTISGISAWNHFVYNKNSEVANTLLNSGAMYLLIGADAYRTSGRTLSVTFDGSDHFQADILRPIEVGTWSSDKFDDGVEFGQPGSFISMADLINLKDWRLETFSAHDNYWNYYGPCSIMVDLDNVEWEYGGKRQVLPDNIQLIQVDPGVTSVRDSQTGETVTLPANSHGYLMYSNTGDRLQADFALFVKVAITYGFGVYYTDWVTIPVEKSSVPTEVSVSGDNYKWVSITSVDNNTPLYDIAWKKNAQFGGDRWFSESGGLVTDNKSWQNGTTLSMGRFTFHRFNNNQYTCNFDDKYNEGKEDPYGETVAYGIAARDLARNTLPTESINGVTYYVLGLEKWESWKPLYVPYSKSYINRIFSESVIMVKINAS